MAGREIEVSLLNEKFFHASQHLGSVTVAELGDEHAHRKRLALAQRSGKKTRPVVELRRRLCDPVPCLLRNRAYSRRVIKYERNRSWRQIQVVSECPQADRLARLGVRTWFGSFGHALQL